MQIALARMPKTRCRCAAGMMEWKCIGRSVAFVCVRVRACVPPLSLSLSLALSFCPCLYAPSGAQVARKNREPSREGISSPSASRPGTPRTLRAPLRPRTARRPTPSAATRGRPRVFFPQSKNRVRCRFRCRFVRLAALVATPVAFSEPSVAGPRSTGIGKCLQASSCSP